MFLLSPTRADFVWRVIKVIYNRGKGAKGW